MRILFCSQAAHVGGGVEAWLESLSHALVEYGWDVITALAKSRFHDPERYARRHRVVNRVEIDGMRGFREERILELLRHFERLRPDIILPVNLADAIDAASLWKTRGGSARLAMCIHGQEPDRVDQVRTAVAFVDLAVSVSRRVAGILQAIMGEPARVLHIPAGVPPPREPLQPREAIRNIAYIGRLDHGDKRIGDAVIMIRELASADVVFHFVGAGPEEGWLRRELDPEIASGRVVFHGDLPRARLYDAIYPSIDAVVVFSEKETGPIVAWEAMAHGVVPVVSDYIGRSEENVIRNNESGIVFPVGDPRAGARAILAAMTGQRISALSRQARAALPASYTLASFGRQWHQALAHCLEMPLRVGDAGDLPRMVSPGVVARLGMGLEGTARVRRLFGRHFIHQDPGSEWPH